MAHENLRDEKVGWQAGDGARDLCHVRCQLPPLPFSSSSSANGFVRSTLFSEKVASLTQLLRGGKALARVGRFEEETGSSAQYLRFKNRNWV